MKISLEWLRDFIEIELEKSKINELLTFSGIEVEDTDEYGILPDTVKTAKIVSSSMMEGSDHLQICQVDNGKEIQQVVCGAPNCKEGLICVFATPGTTLGNIKIKQAKIRGVESAGMLCSEKELQLSDDHSGILILPEGTPIGIPLRNILRLPDTLFDLEITPNRPDLLGYHGIATDLSACTGNPLSVPEMPDLSLNEITGKPINKFLILDNQAPVLCIRYTARLIKNVKVCESPLWMKQRLIRSGLRPINNIVDVTNYIMLETGHPLHAFDYDKLEGRGEIPEILIRRAHKNESFPALDGLSYKLNSDNLVIADGKKAIALAGVIGGSNSHITDHTVNIVLEAACFDHSNIRRTSYDLKIQTDSSYRFERHLAAETCDYASAMAVKLTLNLAGGELCSGMMDSWDSKKPPNVVPIRPSRFLKLTGLHLNSQVIVNFLNDLGLSYLGEGKFQSGQLNKDIITAKHDDNQNISDNNSEDYDLLQLREKTDLADSALFFEIPPKRIDLTREVDLIEEVIRLYGIDKIKQKALPSRIMNYHSFKVKRNTMSFLIHSGFNEVINLSFIDPLLIDKMHIKKNDERLNLVSLVNPQNSKLCVLRTTLIPQLLNTAAYNLNHSVKQLRIFEVNKIYFENNNLPKNEPLRLNLLILDAESNKTWKNTDLTFGFYQLKGLLVSLLSYLGIDDFETGPVNSGYFSMSEAQAIYVSGNPICEFGKLKPEIAASFDIDLVELKTDIWIADADLENIIKLTQDKVVAYTPVGKFPSVERDLSFLIKLEIKYSDIADEIKKSVTNANLEVDLMDEYKGKQVPIGFRSLTFHLIFSHPEKTLTDSEIEANINLIINKLTSLWKIQMR